MINLSLNIVAYTAHIDQKGPKACKCSPTLEKMVCTIAAIAVEALAIVQVAFLFPFQVIGKGFFFVATQICPCSKSLERIYKKFPSDLVVQIMKTLALAFCIIGNTISLICLAKFSEQCYEFKLGFFPTDAIEPTVAAPDQREILQGNMQKLKACMDQISKKITAAGEYVANGGKLKENWLYINHKPVVWRKWEQKQIKEIQLLSKKISPCFPCCQEEMDYGKLQEEYNELSKKILSLDENFSPTKYKAESA